MNHDTFSDNARSRLKRALDALHELVTQPDAPNGPIGFITHEEEAKS